MDENNSGDNQIKDNLSSSLSAPEEVTALNHSPETGFTDIKPFEFSSNYSSEILSYSLGFLLLLIFLYVSYRLIKHKLLSPKTLNTNPVDDFKRKILEIETNDQSFREHCEALSQALRVLISAITNLNITSLTPYYTKVHLTDHLPLLIPNYIQERAYNLEEDTYLLLKTLEGGEYGDRKTLKEIENLRSNLTQQTKDLGEKYIQAFKIKGQTK